MPSNTIFSILSKNKTPEVEDINIIYRLLNGDYDTRRGHGMPVRLTAFDGRYSDGSVDLVRYALEVRNREPTLQKALAVRNAANAIVMEVSGGLLKAVDPDSATPSTTAQVIVHGTPAGGVLGGTYPEPDFYLAEEYFRTFPKMIMLWTGSDATTLVSGNLELTNCPGWVLCHGQTVTMRDLSSFTVPDMRDRMAIGVATVTPVKTVAGSTWGSLASVSFGHTHPMPHTHNYTHTHTLSAHTHTIATHTHTINLHSHSQTSHTHNMKLHTHAPGSHTHDMSSHTHGLNGHTHGLNAHTHDLAQHTHPIGSHTHGLAGHTHTSTNGHDHSLSAHVHTMNGHTHPLTASHIHDVGTHSHGAGGSTGGSSSNINIPIGTGAFELVADDNHTHATGNTTDPLSDTGAVVGTPSTGGNGGNSTTPVDTGGGNADFTSSDAAAVTDGNSGNVTAAGGGTSSAADTSQVAASTFTLGNSNNTTGPSADSVGPSPTSTAVPDTQATHTGSPSDDVSDGQNGIVNTGNTPSDRGTDGPGAQGTVSITNDITGTQLPSPNNTGASSEPNTSTASVSSVSVQPPVVGLYYIMKL